MSIKTKIIDDIIKTEGGYVNHPNDHGGPTMYGITEQVARANGYQGAMNLLPRSLAVKIYEKKYWDALNLDQIEALSPLIAAEIIDTGVNTGPFKSAQFFQTALNALNRNQKDYKDIVVDGSIGPGTISAFKAYLDKRRGNDGIKVLLRVLNVLQGHHYLTIAQNNKSQEDFVFGWFKRVGL